MSAGCSQVLWAFPHLRNKAAWLWLPAGELLSGQLTGITACSASTWSAGPRLNGLSVRLQGSLDGDEEGSILSDWPLLPTEKSTSGVLCQPHGAFFKNRHRMLCQLIQVPLAALPATCTVD